MGQIDLSAKVRGGDVWLWQYMSPVLEELKKSRPHSQVELKANYEDREKWVRDILACGTEESLLSVASSLVSGQIIAVNIGQEEDHSTGYPIRFVKIFTIPEG